MTPEIKERVYPSEIRKLVHMNEEKDRLVCAVFKSNAYRADTYDPGWPTNVKGPAAGQVAHTLTNLMEGSGSYVLKIWFPFQRGKTFAHFSEYCLSHLQHAVQDEKLKREYSLHLKTVRADIDSLRLYTKELEDKNRNHQEQQRKWQKLLEDFLRWAPQADRNGASHKTRKAFGAFAKLIDVARTSLQEV